MTQKKQAASIERQISANLRRVYCQDDCNSLPDQFSDLLDQLRSVEFCPKAEADSDPGEHDA